MQNKNLINPFAEGDEWKFPAVERSRIALVERLRIEKSKEVDRLVRQFAQEDRTVPQFLRKS